MRTALLVVIAWLATLMPTLAANLVLVGEVSYRERIALPPQSVLTVSLVDLTLPGRPARLAATANIDSRGQVPLQFTLSFDEQVIDRTHAYGLVAEIASGGRVWFRNAEPLPVDPVTPPGGIMIIVSLLPDPPPGSTAGQAPSTVSLAVSAEIFDTVWVVERIGGQVILPTHRSTLSITGDRRAGGVGGCNNYFTTAEFDGTGLTFAPIVATRMMCTAHAMQQEIAYFSALTAVRGYTLAEDRLTLLDSAGTPLLRFTRADAR